MSGPSAVGSEEDGFYVVVGPDASGVHTFYRVDGLGMVREQYGVDLSGYGVEVPVGSSRDLVVSGEGDLFYLVGCAVFRLAVGDEVDDEEVAPFLDIVEVYGTGLCGDPGDGPKPAGETTFQSPTSLALTGEWTLWVGDGTRVRAVDLADPGRTVSVVLGGGQAIPGPAWCEWTPAGGLRFGGPVEDVASGSDGAFYVAAGGRLEEVRFLDGSWAVRTRAGLDTGCASGVNEYEAHGVAVWQDWEVFVLDRFLGQERVMRLSPAFGWWWPVLERYEMYGLETVRDLIVTRDGNVLALASGSSGETGLIEVTRPQDAMMGLRLAPNFAGPGPMTWELRRGDLGSGLERFDAEGRLQYSDLPGTPGPVRYEYGDGTDGVPEGALKRVVFSGPDSHTDFVYDSRGKLAALRDEDRYETRIRVDDHGDLVLAQNPEGDFRIYLYDEAHRLRSVIGEQGFADVVDYNQAGMVNGVSGMRGFLKAAPDETGWLLNRLSPDTGLPWSPLSGFVTPVLVGLSDYLEDLCDDPSDCDDALPLTFDWCDAGFCRHEMLGTFPPPPTPRAHDPGPISGTCDVPSSLIPCDPAGNWDDVCDDGRSWTWDICMAGQCANLECQGDCGCHPERFGVDCLEKMIAETGFGPELATCESMCCASFQIPGGSSCPDSCHEDCARAVAKSVAGGVEVSCELAPGTLGTCFQQNQLPWCFGLVGYCKADPFECEEDGDCDDENECTVDRCVCEDPPSCHRKRCSHQNLADDTECEDRNACTGVGHCMEGRCVRGEFLSCDDGDACTTDACVPWLGCVYTPVVCDKADDCVVGTCDPVLGCPSEFEPSGTPCISPSRPCAEAECNGVGECIAFGTPEEDCDDHDPCTVDHCTLFSWGPECDWHEYRCEEIPIEGGGVEVGWGYGLKFPREIIRLQEDGQTTAWPEEDDADRDGLHDKAEWMLAAHFRPFFVFDSQGEGLDDWEPVVLYQAHPYEYGEAKEMIRIVYLSLWDLDHGYGPCNCSIFDVIPTCFCSNAHVGDSEATILLLERNPRTDAWEPSFILVGDPEEPAEYLFNYNHFPEVKDAFGLLAEHYRMENCHALPKMSSEFYGVSDSCPGSGFHPPVFYSASKNHPFLHAYGDVIHSPHSDFGCCDDVNGAGVRRLADIHGCRFNGVLLPFGNNVGEVTPSAACDEIIINAYGYSQRWCVERHHPSKFVNLLDECVHDSQGDWWFRHENAWELALHFAGGYPFSADYCSEVCANYNWWLQHHQPWEQYPNWADPCFVLSQQCDPGCALVPPQVDDGSGWWDAMRDFLSAPEETPPPGDPSGGYRCLRNKTAAG